MSIKNKFEQDDLCLVISDTNKKLKGLIINKYDDDKYGVLTSEGARIYKEKDIHLISKDVIFKEEMDEQTYWSYAYFHPEEIRPIYFRFDTHELAVDSLISTWIKK